MQMEMANFGIVRVNMSDWNWFIAVLKYMKYFHTQSNNAFLFAGLDIFVVVVIAGIACRQKYFFAFLFSSQLI